MDINEYLETEGVFSKPKVVQQEKPQIDRFIHHILVQKNKREVQILTVEKYQWYSIEVAKAFCLNEQRHLVDMVYEDGVRNGYKPFTIRPIKSERPGDKTDLIEAPTVKPDKEGGTIRWFIPWKHNAATPSFITYSPLPFSADNLHYRFIDIDFGSEGEDDQMKNYCNQEEYGKYYRMMCDHNMVAKKMHRADVDAFQQLLKTTAKSIADKLGIENMGCRPLFSGGGFRVLAKSDDKDKLAKQINTWVNDRLVCTSSTMEYQPQKLFSVQTLKDHFQTEIDPMSENFRFSNPAFFFCGYSTELLRLIFDYYKSFLKDSYEYGPDLYTRMRERQVSLEKDIIAIVKQREREV